MYQKIMLLALVPCAASLALLTTHVFLREKPMRERSYSRGNRPEAADLDRLENFRQSGLRKDKSLVSDMINILNDPPLRGYTYTTIHALAQLGATEALPVIKTYSQDETDIDLSRFSIAAEARLQAENEASHAVDSHAGFKIKVLRFYRDLNMTPQDLNTDVAAYQAQFKPSPTTGTFTFVADAPVVHPVGVYAMREIADMMYHGGYADCASMPQITQLDFTADGPSALKMRLAPLSPSARLTTMIQELAHKQVLRAEDSYEVQLAGNEGKAASLATATQLEEMEARPKQYQEVGFTALARVLWTTGDKGQVPLIMRLMDENLVSSSANLILMDLKRGIKHGMVPAY